MSERVGRGRDRGRGSGNPEIVGVKLTPELAAKLKDDGKFPAPGHFQNSSLDQDSNSLGSSGSRALNTSYSSKPNNSVQHEAQPEQNSKEADVCTQSHRRSRPRRSRRRRSRHWRSRETLEIKEATMNVQAVTPSDSPPLQMQEASSVHSKQLTQTMVPGTATFLSNGYPSPPGRNLSATSPNITMSKLNPLSTKCVPRPNSFLLNPAAPVFVPRFGFVIFPTDETYKAGLQQDNSNGLTVLDILAGFERKCKESTGLLTMVANLLLDATNFPATFDTHLEKISELVQKKEIPDDVKEDLAEMLLTWGINNSDLRYTSAKMCDYFCQMPIKDVFLVQLFTKLQNRYKTEKKADHSDPSDLIELSLFMAELFYRVRIGKPGYLEPIWILAAAIFELIFVLLELRQDKAVTCVCNILKLCGKTLDNKPRQSKFDPGEKMELVLAFMRALTIERSISERTSSVLISVLEKKATKWGEADMLSASLSTCTQANEETPVTNESDWNNYLDEKGNLIEGTDYDPGVTFEDQLDPEIDEELFREYVKFVREVEDYLLMLEFGIRKSNMAFVRSHAHLAAFPTSNKKIFI